MRSFGAIEKVEHFEQRFAHPLKSVEWVVKWPIEFRGQKTYNPDYFCESLNCFIELATSYNNVCEYSEKWQKAIRAGYPLRVFWWEGQEITDSIEKYGWWSAPRPSKRKPDPE